MVIGPCPRLTTRWMRRHESRKSMKTECVHWLNSDGPVLSHSPSSIHSSQALDHALDHSPRKARSMAHLPPRILSQPRRFHATLAPEIMLSGHLMTPEYRSFAPLLFTLRPTPDPCPPPRPTRMPPLPLLPQNLNIPHHLPSLSQPLNRSTSHSSQGRQRRRQKRAHARK
jgi:hypothetical protein